MNVSVTDVDEYDVSAISDENASTETLAAVGKSGAEVGITQPWRQMLMARPTASPTTCPLILVIC